MSIRTLIVEDHGLTLAGLRTALSGDPAIEVAGEAADGPSGWEAIVALQPDVAVVDIGLPGFDGIALTQRIRESYPNTRVVIVTMVDLQEQVLAALAAGADAYCLKNSDPARIVEAVKIAQAGGAYFDPQIAHVVLSRFSPSAAKDAAAESPLTQRELEVLRLVADGVGNADIAAQLHIGLGTVKGHVRDILEKLSAADRTQAAVVALRRGYI
ncbi:MAG: response regulator transcription factor [Candidatus Eremiobacteraeota bacterium]|nr:response regulator transcription factor [Candidatus Eremiobacteraeota bacterium]